MKRRDFLKCTMVAAGTLVVGSACGDDDGDGPIEVGESYYPQSVASGDPKPDSVILWTRVVDTAATGDIELTLQMARDDKFAELFDFGGAAPQIVAKSAFDSCVKVRVTGLAAGTTWYYRFLYAKDGKRFASRTGRTRTAPALDADATVRFAVLNCQDYTARYFNTYKQLVTDDKLDFFVHLGDYIYETTANKEFQNKSKDRAVKLTDLAGAIVFNKGTDDEFHAAKSLDNYRELYRIYRADADLQRAHESMAMIAIADDHEFSDDCYGQTGTYYDGAQDELDPERRSNSDKAWFEYMPVDYADPAFVYDGKPAFPDDLRTYRDFKFGKHLHLVMTDLRRYRADHVIAEDAFPGEVVLDEDAAKAANGGTVPTFAAPYFDIDAYQGGKYKTLLSTNADKLGYPQDLFKGNISASWVNSQLKELSETEIADTELQTMKVGVAYADMFKIARFSAVGSRYFLLEEPFLLVAKARYEQSKGKSELVFGDTQRKWFYDTIKGSDRTWKVWGSEYIVSNRLLDLTELALAPAAFQKRFLISAEDWDGLPNRREELLETLGAVDNFVVVSGDLHSFWAFDSSAASDASKGLIEIAGGGVSSGTYQDLITRLASSSPALAAAGGATLSKFVPQLLRGELGASKHPNPHMAHNELDRHGFVVVEVDGKELRATMHEIPPQHVTKSLSTADLKDKFELVKFKVAAGKRELLVEDKGAYKRWDSKAGKLA